MKRKIITKLVLIILLVISLLIPTHIVFADSGIDPYLVGDPNSSTMSEFDNIGGVIFGAIQTIGVVVSVIVVVVIGIKYMIGSLEEKAEYKKNILNYVLGAVFLALATSIPNMIYNLHLF